jgi:hypothetical protein
VYWKSTKGKDKGKDKGKGAATATASAADDNEDEEEEDEEDGVYWKSAPHATAATKGKGKGKGKGKASTATSTLRAGRKRLPMSTALAVLNEVSAMALDAVYERPAGPAAACSSSVAIESKEDDAGDGSGGVSVPSALAVLRQCGGQEVWCPFTPAPFATTRRALSVTLSPIPRPVYVCLRRCFGPCPRRCSRPTPSPPTSKHCWWGLLLALATSPSTHF